MKTQKQIENDIISLVRGSALQRGVNGSVYRAGLRPRDSKKEDIIVSFISGLPGQIQTGVVSLSIYVPDINNANGVYVEDGRRVAVIELLAQSWVDALTAQRSKYLFAQDMVISSSLDENINQHFVVVRLSYQLFE